MMQYLSTTFDILYDEKYFYVFRGNYVHFLSYKHAIIIENKCESKEKHISSVKSALSGFLPSYTLFPVMNENDQRTNKQPPRP